MSVKRLLTDETGKEIASSLNKLVATTSKVHNGHTISLLDANNEPMYVFSSVAGGILFDVSPYPTKEDTYESVSTYIANKTYYYLSNEEYVEDTNVVDSASFTSELALHGTLYIKNVYSFKGWCSDLSDEDSRISFPMYQLTEDLVLYPYFTTGESCYIGQLGSSNTTNVTFSKSTGFPTEQQAYEEVVIDGNVFAKFNTWYKKAIYNGDELIGFEISDTKESDNFVPYDCFLDEEGNVLPYILIGKYCLSSTTVANSVDATRATMTIGTGRALCRALGTGYQQMDGAIFNFWRDLALAISQIVNFNSGEGVASYLGLARMTEGGWWLDGITHIDSTYLYSYKPSKYIDSPTANTDGYNALSYAMPTSSNYITKLGYDSNHPTINMPSAVGGSASTYYCDYLYYASGNRPCSCNVGNAYAGSGLFYLDGSDGWSSAYGVRLCYKPIA